MRVGRSKAQMWRNAGCIRTIAHKNENGFASKPFHVVPFGWDFSAG